MLPKERRLRRREDFDKIFQTGRVVKRPQLRTVWAPGKGRAGVVAAKSIGSVAYRNTVKRRWREALREIEFPQNLDVVFIVREEGAKERGEKVGTILAEALSQLPK